jgi:hypothetical protein
MIAVTVLSLSHSQPQFLLGKAEHTAMVLETHSYLPFNESIPLQGLTGVGFSSPLPLGKGERAMGAVVFMTHTYLLELSATAAAEDFSFDAERQPNRSIGAPSPATVATPSMAKEHLT